MGSDRFDTPPPPPPPPSEEMGPRSAALRSRKKDRRKRAAQIAVAGLLAAALIGGGVSLLGDPETAPESPIEVLPSMPPDATTSVLLIGKRTNQEDESRVIWVSLMTADEEEGTGSIIYMPAHTAVEVPGRGLQGLDDAWQTGGVPLVLVTLENLLGIGIDGYLEMSANDALVALEKVGSLSVDVPEDVRVSAGGSRVRLILAAGEQTLAPPFVVDLLYTPGLDANDIELGSRHLSFWDALFDRFAEEPDVLGRAIRGAEGALATSDTSPERLGRLFRDLAALPAASRTIRALPVTPLEVPGNRLYATDETEVAEFMAEVVGDRPSGEDPIRVQILNGNGEPGIGQVVADRLVGHGFRVILSGNARRLNYRTTKIITYDASAEGQGLARRAQELLEVGEVQVSVQEQGIVDLTIVVGKDFLRTL